MPHHTKIRDNIKEILDVDLIKQQAEQGILDFHHYSRYVLSIMSKICAPVRDDRIKELGECTNVIETFRGIMEVLQLMRLDLANFTITMMRPNIVASSIEYEKTKFAEFLKVQADGLQYTRRWLLKHFDEEKHVAASQDSNGIKQVTHNLLAEAYLDLLEWDSSPDAEVRQNFSSLNAEESPEFPSVQFHPIPFFFFNHRSKNFDCSNFGTKNNQYFGLYRPRSSLVEEKST